MKASQLRFVQTAAIAAAIVAAGSFGQVFAQEAAPPVGDAAPPVSDTAPPVTPDDSTNPATAPKDAPAPDVNVFNWKDVPANQQIVIDRAVFDQGGYQLYCHTGETIVVPFADQNLYVMKFGRSDSGTYFVNDGTTPTLYLPQGGYLENAAASNAKWYPFPDDYDYSQPVYEGVAPSWDAYVSMAWYPDMECYGGYWGYHPYGPGAIFSPLPGFCISIYDQPYYGWNSYRSYYVGHPESRVYFRTAPVFRYNQFPAHGRAWFAGKRPFATGNVSRPQGVVLHSTPAFGRPTTGGNFGTTHGAVSPDTNRATSPATAHTWGATSPAPVHVWGATTPTGRTPFTSATAGTSTSPARTPFGGATYASPYQGGTSRGAVVNGTAQHNWGTTSPATTWGSGNSTYGSNNNWRSTPATGSISHVWTSGTAGSTTPNAPRPAAPVSSGTAGGSSHPTTPGNGGK